MTTEKEILKKLKKDGRALGIYQKEFDTGYEMAAKLLTQFHSITNEIEEQGGKLLIMDNDGKVMKHPYVPICENLRKDILSYLNALGLTRSALKKLDVEQKKGEQTFINSIGELLKK